GAFLASLGLTGPTVANWDTKQQPKVVERLLLLHIEHWSQLMLNTNAYSTPQTPDVKVSLLGSALVLWTLLPPTGEYWVLLGPPGAD
uniref:Uncharacterized protein n=1 Tax=Anser cygnoides TaxID=8845 RepID=A0A8B9EMD1_ANSCY